MNVRQINLLAIINDVLDFSKLEAGKLILESIHSHYAARWMKSLPCWHILLTIGLELTLNIKSDVLIRYRRPLRLQQIITNLVGNAIKFTENGNIDILVEKNVR